MCAGKTVWLVGMMGAGKSAVGAALARHLGRRFIDTDREIAGETGRSIGEIFAEEGEAAFRALERATVERLAGAEVVVALGGGAIAQPGMAELLTGSGTVVYLRAKIATLLARLDGCEDRPLLAGLDPSARRRRLEALLAERREAYETAAISVDTDGSPVPSVVDGLLRRISPAASQISNESGP